MRALVQSNTIWKAGNKPRKGSTAKPRERTPSVRQLQQQRKSTGQFESSGVSRQTPIWVASRHTTNKHPKGLFRSPSISQQALPKCAKQLPFHSQCACSPKRHHPSLSKGQVCTSSCLFLFILLPLSSLLFLLHLFLYRLSQGGNNEGRACLVQTPPPPPEVSRKKGDLERNPMAQNPLAGLYIHKIPPAKRLIGFKGGGN